MTAEDISRASDYRHWAQEIAALLFEARLNKEGLADWSLPTSPLASKIDEMRDTPSPQRNEEWNSTCLLSDGPTHRVHLIKQAEIVVPESVDFDHLRETVSKLESEGPQEVTELDIANASTAINEIILAIRRFWPVP